MYDQTVAAAGTATLNLTEVVVIVHTCHKPQFFFIIVPAVLIAASEVVFVPTVQPAVAVFNVPDIYTLVAAIEVVPLETPLSDKRSICRPESHCVSVQTKDHIAQVASKVLKLALYVPRTQDVP